MTCRSRHFWSPSHDVGYLIDNGLPIPPQAQINEAFCGLPSGHEGWHTTADGTVSWPDQPVTIERWVSDS